VPITVELLYFEGCPSYVAFLPRLRAPLAEGGVDAPVLRRRGESDQAARRERFLGSPTVRIDGLDVEPSAAQRLRAEVPALCEPRPTAGVPPDEWLLDAPARADDRG
jgi:hypothetical protein